MALDVNDVKFRISVTTTGDGQIQQLQKSTESLKKSADGIQQGFARFGGVLKGIAAGFVIREISIFTRDIFRVGTELKNMSQNLGISISDFAKIKVAAEVSEIPMDNLQVALRRLNVSLGAAAIGNAAAVASFKSLGVSFRDSSGNLKTAGPALLDIADAFTRLKDGPEKAAVATKLFGRAGQDMTAMLNLGREGINKFSLAITTDFALRADKFADDLALMKNRTQNLAFTFFNDMLPALQESIDLWSKYDIKITQSTGATAAMSDAVRLLAISLKTITGVVGQFIDIILTKFNELTIVIGYGANVVGDFFSTIGKSAKAAAKGDFEEVAKILEESNVKALAQRKLFYEKEIKLRQEFSERANARKLNTLLFSQGVSENSNLFGGAGAADRARAATTPPPGNEATARNKMESERQNDKLKKERETIEVFRAQGVEQQALYQLEMRRHVLSIQEYENQKDILKTDFEATKATKGWAKENEVAYRKLASYQEKQREDQRKQIALQEESYGVGAKQAIDEYVEASRKGAEQVKSAFTATFRQLEDNMVQFVETGKFNFKELTIFILREIERIAIRQTVIAPILGAIGGIFTGAVSGGASGASTPGGDSSSINSSYTFGQYSSYAKGGIMSSQGNVPLNYYAKGGIANSPQMSIFGEGATPEAYVPLPDGRRIPVALMGSSGSKGDTSVVVNVNVESGSENKTANSKDAAKLGDAISAAVRQEIVSQKRAGGLLA